MDGDEIYDLLHGRIEGKQDDDYIDPRTQKFYPQRTATQILIERELAMRHAQQMQNFQRYQYEAEQQARMAAIQLGHFDAQIKCMKHDIVIEQSQCSKCLADLEARQKEEIEARAKLEAQKIEERKALFGQKLYDLMEETDWITKRILNADGDES